MRRYSLIAISLLISSITSFAQLFQVTANVNDNGDAVFKIKQANEVTKTTATGYGFIQLSKDKTFTTPDYIKRFTTKGTTISSKETEFLTLTGSEFENGDYYWRVFFLKSSTDNNGAYTSKKTITFGSKDVVETPEVGEDNTVYENVELKDDIELSIEPVWLRSDNSGSPLASNQFIQEPNGTSPNVTKPYAIEFIPYSHGMIVNNNIIYIARGAVSPINWNFDKTKLEIDRYNLLTGEKLETTIVNSSDGEFYGQSAMSLLSEDADGTVYFTTSKLDENNVLSYVNLYTLTFPEDIESGNPILTAYKQKEFTIPADILQSNNMFTTNNSHIFVVEGSIADKSYNLWCSSPSTVASKDDNFSDVIFKWVVEGKDTSFEYAYINNAQIMASDFSDYKGGLSRVTPLGNNRIYYHSIRKNDQVVSITPALYEFNSDEHICNFISSASDIENTKFTQLDHSILGISRTYFENRPFVAFGQSSENGSHIGIAELTADDEMSFKDANLLWILNQDGFSKNQQQGCDIKLIDNPMTTFADETPSSKLLLAYMPNAGMGLYNVSAVNTTGINDIIEDNTQCNFLLQGRILYVTAPVKCTLTNMSGYQYAFNPTNMQVDLSSLASGLYILQFEGDTSANKVVLK